MNKTKYRFYTSIKGVSMFTSLIREYHNGNDDEIALLNAALEKMVTDGDTTVIEIQQRTRSHIALAYKTMFPIDNLSSDGIVIANGVKYIRESGVMTQIHDAVVEDTGTSTSNTEVLTDVLASTDNRYAKTGGDVSVPFNASDAVTDTQVTTNRQARNMINDTVGKYLGGIETPGTVSGVVELSNMERTPSSCTLNFEGACTDYKMLGGVDLGKVAEGSRACVLKGEDGIYRMWVTVGVEIGLYTGTDGINWDYHGIVVPLGPAGSIDSGITYHPCVLMVDGEYKMYYSANGGTVTEALATSTDGINWTKQGMVLPTGGVGSIDYIHVHSASVWKTTTGYDMLYGAWDANHDIRVARATSTDGITWVKQGVIYLGSLLDRNLYPGGGICDHGNGVLSTGLFNAGLGSGTNAVGGMLVSTDNGGNWSVQNYLPSATPDRSMPYSYATGILQEVDHIKIYYNTVNDDTGLLTIKELPGVQDTQYYLDKLSLGETYSTTENQWVKCGLRGRNMHYSPHHMYSSAEGNNDNLAFIQNGFRLLRYTNTVSTVESLGPELITNSDFATGIDNWVLVGGAGLSYDTHRQQAIISSPVDEPNSGISQTIVTVPGNHYIASWTRDSNTVTDNSHILVDGGFNWRTALPGGYAQGYERTETFVASSVSTTITFISSYEQATVIRLSNFSIKEVTPGLGHELLPNTSFVNIDNVIGYNNGILSVAERELFIQHNGTNNPYLTMDVELTEGKLYYCEYGTGYSTSGENVSILSPDNSELTKVKLHKSRNYTRTAILKPTISGTHKFKVESLLTTAGGKISITHPSIREFLPTHWEDLTPVNNNEKTEVLDYNNYKFTVRASNRGTDRYTYNSLMGTGNYLTPNNSSVNPSSTVWTTGPVDGILLLTKNDQHYNIVGHDSMLDGSTYPKLFMHRNAFGNLTLVAYDPVADAAIGIGETNKSPGAEIPLGVDCSDSVLTTHGISAVISNNSMAPNNYFTNIGSNGLEVNLGDVGGRYFKKDSIVLDNGGSTSTGDTFTLSIVRNNTKYFKMGTYRPVSAGFSVDLGFRPTVVYLEPHSSEFGYAPFIIMDGRGDRFSTDVGSCNKLYHAHSLTPIVEEFFTITDTGFTINTTHSSFVNPDWIMSYIAYGGEYDGSFQLVDRPTSNSLLNTDGLVVSYRSPGDNVANGKLVSEEITSTQLQQLTLSDWNGS